MTNNNRPPSGVATATRDYPPYELHNDAKRYYIETSNGKVIAIVDGDQQANAAHIVKCVNSHDNLVEALKDLLSWEAVIGSQANKSIARAKQALKEAGE